MRKAGVCLLLSVFFLLFQVCAMSDLAIGNINGYLLFAFMAVVIVSLGKKYTYCVSVFFGICIYCTVESFGWFDLVMYPISAMVTAAVFSDRSDKKREQRAIAGKNTDDLPALLRIILSCAMMCAIYHTICIGYSFLSNDVLTFGHIGRALLSTLYSVGLTLVIMIPCRAALGLYTQRRRLKKIDREREQAERRAAMGAVEEE